jgi:FMN phosphatase YigB (HAD superfamily)
MSRLKNIKALLIDMDDTIVRFKNSATNGSAQAPGSLFDVLQSAGVLLAGLTPQETARRIEKIKDEIQWWHWSDFIVALELNPRQFWEYAYQAESKYLEATGAEILPALQRLRAAGILLYVASNNPSSGILHKLRLAGIAHVNGSTLFSQLLGATELRAMKWEPMYWKKALAHIALDGDEVAVVGDNPHDDYEVPQSVGITHTFLIDRRRDRTHESTFALTYVSNFDQIVESILEGRDHVKTGWQNDFAGRISRPLVAGR